MVLGIGEVIVIGLDRSPILTVSLTGAAYALAGIAAWLLQVRPRTWSSLQWLIFMVMLGGSVIFLSWYAGLGCYNC